MKFWIFFVATLFGLSACTQNPPPAANQKRKDENPLYALTGQERQVKFQALFRSNEKKIEDLDPSNIPSEIRKVTAFLFGPLTYRDIGGAQKGEKITAHIDQAFVQGRYVFVPYTYEAVWMIHSRYQGTSLSVPLPYSISGLITPKWKNCNDSGDHREDWGFLWYFWDPLRDNCDHQLSRHYQEVEIEIGTATPQTTRSFPEYSRLIRTKDGIPTLSMTFAFGYVEEPDTADPFKDHDYGMSQFRLFYDQVAAELLSLNFKKVPILQKDIARGSTTIGTKFIGDKNGVHVEVSILAAAGVDQMDIFAHSYAQDHDGFFGWFGHSRVGSGFDAQMFAYKLETFPQRFSLTTDYQIIYWAGCNSYSYYTLPFFELKADLNPTLDPNGTANLDLISNALPSLFSLNADNAWVLFAALFNWEAATSYQDIIKNIENSAAAWRTQVIVNVLGDEDNPQ